MRILLFDSGESGFGGSFRSCFYIADILKRNNHSPLIFAMNNSFYWEKLKAKGIKVKMINHIFFTKNKNFNFFNKVIKRVYSLFRKYFPYFLVFFNRLIYFDLINKIKRCVVEEKIELIQTNIHFIRDISVFITAVNLKIPVVSYLRNMPDRPLIYSEKKLARYEQGCFIAISKAVLEAWVKAGLPENNIKLIYNAQPQKNTNKTTQNSDYTSRNGTVGLLFLGRLSKNKGVHLLIEALSNIKSRNWKLSIVGKGSEEKYLKELVVTKGLNSSIFFHGFQANVEKFYRRNDILIVPSLNEPFGRVIIEGMFYGIAIIASNAGGIPEIIDDGKDGILFAPGNTIQLGSAIETLMNNRDKRSQFVENGKRKVEIKFSENIFFNKLITAYKQVLTNNL